MLTFAFSVIFLIQLGHLISKYVQPTELNTVMKIVKKGQLEEFPLVFQFCLRPGFNMTELENHGYAKLDNYFWGWTETSYNVGWGGKNGPLTPEGLIKKSNVGLTMISRVAESEFFGGLSLSPYKYSCYNLSLIHI